MSAEEDRLGEADRVLLALALDPVTPDDALRRRARARALFHPGPGVRALRYAEGDWRTLLPGIEVKRLRSEPERGIETCLWRLAAGAEIPRHPHRVGETCLVVCGEIELEGTRWTAGDWVEVERGGDHGVVRSDVGALLLIASEPLPIWSR